jgi:hypothetical protein
MLCCYALMTQSEIILRVKRVLLCTYKYNSPPTTIQINLLAREIERLMIWPLILLQCFDNKTAEQNGIGYFSGLDQIKHLL